MSGERMMQADVLKEKYKGFLNTVSNDPLLEVAPSLAGVELSAVEKNSGGTIYYGTGLTTPRAMGVGLPFDVLGMILTAEKLRRAVGYSGIIHHVADTHAKTNEWIDPVAVDGRARNVRDVLVRVASNLKLEGFEVRLASEFDNSEEYGELVRYFHERSEKHEYVIREMADMEWYRRYHRTGIKLSWIIQASEVEEGFDERLFDREYVRIVGRELAFVYTKPGRTFDLSRPKASPYIQVTGESRLLLDRGENVRSSMAKAVEACGDPHLGGARKHLENIVRTYEKLYGSMGNRVALEDKLQQIIDLVTG